MTKKYTFTGETMDHNGVMLNRIISVRGFAGIQEGALGGWIESEKNLSHQGVCWVANEAKVYNKAKLYESSIVYDKAEVYENAIIAGLARIGFKAMVSGHSEVRGRALVKSNAIVKGTDILLDIDAVICDNAVLNSSKDIVCFYPMSQTKSTLTVYKSTNGVMVTTPCFCGTPEQYLQLTQATHEKADYKFHKSLIDIAKLRILS